MDYVDYELEEDAPRFGFSSRFGMAVLGFIGFFTMSSQKMSLQIALVCMLNETASAIVDGEDTYREMPLQYHVNDVTEAGNLSLSENYTIITTTPATSHNEGCGVAADVFREYVKVNWIEDVTEKGTLVWDQTKRNVIFQTYYLGYMFIQIPAGMLAQRFGGKKVLGFFLLSASIATLLIPFGVRYHYFLLVFLRFIGGVGAGAAFPAMHCLLGRWAPPHERSKLASISYAGALTGALVTYPITTSLCRFGYDEGWPLIFYVLGGAGFLWFGLWISSASDSPLEHKRISKEEKDYIVTVLSRQTDLEPVRHMNLPCPGVISSLPFLAIVVSNFVYDWGLYVFENVVPEFLYKKLDMDMRKVTLFSMMPYVSLWICVIMSGIWSDQLRARGVIGTRTTRKIFEFIGCIVPAAMTVGLGFLNCTQWQGAVAMVILGFSFLGFQYNGFLVNHLDIAPRYAGVLMGISNTFGTLAHFTAPFMVNVISTEDTTEQWQTIFLSTGCLYLFGLFIFLICGSGELQPWAGVTRPQNSVYATTPINLNDPKRSSKLYTMNFGAVDGDVRGIKQVSVPASVGTYHYQAMSPQIVPPDARVPNGPQRQTSLSNKQRPTYISNRPDDVISPYATLPRTRDNDFSSSHPTGRSRSGRVPEIEGYPTLRKHMNLDPYRPSFRKSLGPGDLPNDTSRQYLIPPTTSDRKGSRSSRDSRSNRTSADLSNRSSRNSTDMNVKRQSSRMSADVSAYNDLSESIV